MSPTGRLLLASGMRDERRGVDATQYRGDISDLWQRCLARLAAELSAEDMHTYLAPLQASEQGDRCACWPPMRTRSRRSRRSLPEIERSLAHLGDANPGRNRNRRKIPIERPFDFGRARRIYRTLIVLEAILHQMKYSPKNFIEGKLNQLGKAAAIQVAMNRGRVSDRGRQTADRTWEDGFLMHVGGESDARRNIVTKGILFCSIR